jgi:hypothetical protein
VGCWTRRSLVNDASLPSHGIIRSIMTKETIMRMICMGVSFLHALYIGHFSVSSFISAWIYILDPLPLDDCSKSFGAITWPSTRESACPMVGGSIIPDRLAHKNSGEKSFRRFPRAYCWSGTRGGFTDQLNTNSKN